MYKKMMLIMLQSRSVQIVRRFFALIVQGTMIEIKHQKNTEHSLFKIIKMHLHSFWRPAIAVMTMTKGMNCNVEFTSVYAVSSA